MEGTSELMLSIEHRGGAAVRLHRFVGEHFQIESTQSSSQFPSPIRFALPNTHDKASEGNWKRAQFDLENPWLLSSVRDANVAHGPPGRVRNQVWELLGSFAAEGDV